MIPLSEIHHIEVPCSDLGRAEEFYGRVFGAKVYYRKASDGSRAPLDHSIAQLRSDGIEVSATFLDLGSNFRIGFLSRQASHQQHELDHLAFTVAAGTLEELREFIAEARVETVRESPYFIVVRDCFGMQLELYPEPLLGQLSANLRLL